MPKSASFSPHIQREEASKSSLNDDKEDGDGGLVREVERIKRRKCCSPAYQSTTRASLDKPIMSDRDRYYRNR